MVVGSPLRSGPPETTKGTCDDRLPHALEPPAAQAHDRGRVAIASRRTTMPRSRSPGKYPHWRESWLHDGLSPITTSLPAGTCRSDAPAWSGRQPPGRGSPGTPATLLTIHARRPVDLYNGVLQAPSMPGDSMITTCPARSWLSRARRTSTRSPGCSVGNMLSPFTVTTTNRCRSATATSSPHTEGASR